MTRHRPLLSTNLAKSTTAHNCSIQCETEIAHNPMTLLKSVIAHNWRLQPKTEIAHKLKLSLKTEIAHNRIHRTPSRYPSNLPAP